MEKPYRTPDMNVNDLALLAAVGGTLLLIHARRLDGWATQWHPPDRAGLGHAILCATAGFLFSAGFAWHYHPLLVKRHPERILGWCLLTALVALVGSMLVRRFRHADE